MNQQPSESNNSPMAGGLAQKRRKKVSRVDMNRHPAVIAYLRRVPISYRGVYRKAYGGNSLAAAIKAMCLDCTNNQRQEVRFCQCYACPLYPYRPYQNEKGGTNDD